MWAVSPELIMDKFKGKTHMPTFNFGGDIRSAERSLLSTQIETKLCVSKNVCHRVKYNRPLHEALARRLRDFSTFEESSFKFEVDNSEFEVLTPHESDCKSSSTQTSTQLHTQTRQTVLASSDLEQLAVEIAPTTYEEADGTALNPYIQHLCEGREQEQTHLKLQLAESNNKQTCTVVASTPVVQNQTKTKEQRQKRGFELIYHGMDVYLKTKDHKKLHDPLAAVVAVDRSVCQWKKVSLILH